MRSSDFVNHLYDYRPNWTPLGPVTITYCTDPGLQLEIRHHSLVCRCGLADILYILESFFKPYIQYVTSMHHASKTHVEVFLLNLRYEARYETTTTTTNKQIIDNA